RWARRKSRTMVRSADIVCIRPACTAREMWSTLTTRNRSTGFRNARPGTALHRSATASDLLMAQEKRRHEAKWRESRDEEIASCRTGVNIHGYLAKPYAGGCRK